MTPPLPETAELEFQLQLFITGATPNSLRAMRNAYELCEQHLPGRYTLTVIDIYQQPDLARQQQVLAAPTLVRLRPLPRRQVIGDLSASDKVMTALGLLPGE